MNGSGFPNAEHVILSEPPRSMLVLDGFKMKSAGTKEEKLVSDRIYLFLFLPSTSTVAFFLAVTSPIVLLLVMLF